MATKIVTKNSSTASAVPTASDLVQGELAVNVADKRLFTEDNAGAIVELGTNPSGNVTFQDNGKAIFGASGDLQIYHDGSNSYIKDLGTGDLLLSGNAGVQIQSDAGENMITTAANGAVSLFYDASAKLATTPTGIDVTGTATMDGLTVDGIPTATGDARYEVVISEDQTASAGRGGGIAFARQGDILGGIKNTLDATASNSQMSFQTRLSGTVATKMTLDASGNVGIGTSSPAANITIDKGLGAASPTTFTTANSYLQLGVSDYNSSGGVYAIGFGYSGGATHSPAYIGLQQTETGSYTKGDLVFRTRSTSTDVEPPERMRIDSSGSVGIGVTPESHYTGYTAVDFGVSSSIFGNTTTADTNALGIANNAYLNSGATNWIYKETDEATRYTQSNGTHVWHYAASGTAGDAITWSEAMRITSSGRVGIGEQTPLGLLHLRNDGDTADLILQVSGGSGRRYAIQSRTDGSLATYDSNAGTERMRIDSSGNLLVGTTTPNVYNGTTSGVAFTQSGYIFAGKSGDAPLYLNRIASDGVITNFGKDGSTVGSIGVDNGDNLTISGNSSHAGLNFSGSAVNPYKNGNYANGTVDLGEASSARFRDLYLSGGVYLGGTGAANKLDDYEEGTWTPTITGYGQATPHSQTYSVQTGNYTKVGNLVTAHFFVTLSNKGNIASASGNYAFITGLPFTHGGSVAGIGVMWGWQALANAVSHVAADMSSTTTQAWLTQLQGTSGAGTSYMGTSQITNTTSFRGTLIYKSS